MNADSITEVRPVAPGIDAHIAAAVAGGEAAWRELVVAARPMVRRLVARRAPRLDEDGHSDVLVRVLDRLSRHQHRALRRYLDTKDRYPELGFGAYLRSIVATAIVDHLRGRHDRVRRRQQNARRLVAIQLTSLEAGAEPAAPRRDLARLIDVKRLLATLTDIRFPTEQRQALLLWLHGHDAREIAELLDLASTDAATRLLRAARARLRRTVRRDS